MILLASLSRVVHRPYYAVEIVWMDRLYNVLVGELFIRAEAEALLTDRGRINQLILNKTQLPSSELTAA